MVYIWQKLFFNKRYISTDNYNPNYELLAKAYDIEYIKCNNNDKILDIVANFMHLKTCEEVTIYAHFNK